MEQREKGGGDCERRVMTCGAWMSGRERGQELDWAGLGWFWASGMAQVGCCLLLFNFFLCFSYSFVFLKTILGFENAILF
jgi:hypothetical protein